MTFTLALITQEPTKHALFERARRTLPAHLAEIIDVAAWTPEELFCRSERERTRLRNAPIVIVSHVFTDEHAACVGEALDERGADRPLIVLSSLRPLMQRTRLGAFRLDDARAARPPVLDALLNAGDMTEALRELRAALPGMRPMLAAMDADQRAYFAAALAWMEPSVANSASLLLMLAEFYGPAPKAFRGTWSDPRPEPGEGLWHADRGIVRDVRDWSKPDGRPRVAMLVQRSAILAGETDAVAAAVRAFAAQGVEALPMFADGFDYVDLLERFGVPLGIDAVVNLSGFPLAGGHNRSEAERVRAYLRERRWPVLAAPLLLMQDVEAWRRSALGLTPMEVALETAMHELEGGIEPIVAFGTEGSGEAAARVAIPDRLERLAGRAAKWLALRRKPNAEKRVALVIFAFPPGKGSVGTAAYLDVARSVHAILSRLKSEGYDVQVPATPEQILDLIVRGDDKSAPHSAAELAVAARYEVAAYERATPSSRRLHALWGPPPGDLNSDGRRILIQGVRLGSVLVGVQPTFGFEGDPMRLLFAKNATPHHGFLGFYRYIEREFGADAVIHVGTHGALEFMPGKQTGLSGECWPDLLLGDLPNLYLYAVNNPSEGTIAKRRGLALTISHLTPPAEEAGLVRDLVMMKDLIRDFRETASTERRADVVASLHALVESAHLEADVPPKDGEPPEGYIGRCYVAVMDIESRRIPVGLHVIGRAPSDAEEFELLRALGERSEDGGFRRLWFAAENADLGAVETAAAHGDAAASERIRRAGEIWRRVFERQVAEGGDAAVRDAVALQPGIDRDALTRLFATLADRAGALRNSDELTPLMDALSGRYVDAGPGGDPVHSPEVLPSGRNLHALDPSRVPAPLALTRAEAVVTLLLDTEWKANGRLPETVGLVLWGLDNVKTRGEGIAQALVLMGAKPRRNSIGRVSGVDVVSLDELGRPRIDVVCMASGIFRDIFGTHMDLLADAVRQVAALDERDEDNYVRKHVRALTASGVAAEDAVLRVFSNAPGAYGANIDHMVALGKWKERGDLADLFLKRKGFAYSRDRRGTEAMPVLKALAATIDVNFQNIDSAEVSLTDVDHYFEYLGGLSALTARERGEERPARVADSLSAVMKIRDLDAAVRLETRTKLLNPKWYEGMLRHGYEGVEEIRKRFDYTFGWSATNDAVAPWIYREVHRTFVADPAMRERLRRLNPHSLSAMIDRLGEARRRGFWAPADDEGRLLDDLSLELEDELEGI